MTTGIAAATLAKLVIGTTATTNVRAVITGRRDTVEAPREIEIHTQVERGPATPAAPRQIVATETVVDPAHVALVGTAIRLLYQLLLPAATDPAHAAPMASIAMYLVAVHVLSQIRLAEVVTKTGATGLEKIDGKEGGLIDGIRTLIAICRGSHILNLMIGIEDAGRRVARGAVVGRVGRDDVIRRVVEIPQGFVIGRGVEVAQGVAVNPQVFLLPSIETLQEVESRQVVIGLEQKVGHGINSRKSMYLSISGRTWMTRTKVYERVTVGGASSE